MYAPITLHWPASKAEICRKISTTSSFLKIVVKTKDDPSYLAPWIEYHTKIVGPENIIIFDNQSRLPEAMKLLDEYRSHHIVATFGGFHNFIHVCESFPELYDAIRNSSSYFMHLDTDEFLTWTDGERILTDHRITEMLEAHPSELLLPGTWVDNIPRYGDRFRVGSQPSQFLPGLKWGKPIISSSVAISGILHHNAQVRKDVLTSARKTNILILHKKNLSPEMRVRANLRKLEARQVLPVGLSYAEAIDSASRIKSEDSVIAGYVEEILKLKDCVEDAQPPDDALTANAVQMLADGQIRFQNNAQRSALLEFIAHGQQYISEAFGAA
jgi:hypothetical protein